MVLWHGGVIKQEKVVFSTPSHVTYGLYFFEKDQTICVSNSLYLLMAYNGLEMDSEYAGYEVDFNSIRKGVDKYTRQIRALLNGKVVSVKMIYYANLEINNHGSYIIKDKETIPPFKITKTIIKNYYNQ